MINKFVHAGIVNPEELVTLKEHTENAGLNLVFLDGTFVLPTSNEDIKQNYQNKRLPGALFFNIKEIKDTTSDLPHMLPDADTFSNAVGALGITNTDVIVVYGQHGMVMGPARVWWMFKGFGHANIIVLNGGLPAYEHAGLQIETSAPIIPVPSNYTTQPFDETMVTRIDKVLGVAKDRQYPIIDARPANRFSGESPEPREAMRSGHIPGSLNAPASSLVDKDGKLKSREELTALLTQSGLSVENDQRIITTCGSGITACALSLALYHLGKSDVAVYDGSWSEWGLERSSTPVEQSS